MKWIKFNEDELTRGKQHIIFYDGDSVIVYSEINYFVADIGKKISFERVKYIIDEEIPEFPNEME